jgi:RNA polymerase sigma-B factor
MPSVKFSDKSQAVRDRTTELFQQYAAAPTIALRNKIVNLNAGLVRKEARKYSSHVPHSITPLADFEQLGFIGLIKAVERFDVSKNGAFVTYAATYIRGEMMHHNRSDKGLMRVPVTWTEQRDKVIRYQRAIQRLRPDQPVTIADVLTSCPQLNMTIAQWRQIEQANKPQHYAPIDCQCEDDPFVQIPDDEQNTLAIAGEAELLEVQRRKLERYIAYSLSATEQKILGEYRLGVSSPIIAKRNKISGAEVERIIQTAIAKLKTCS